MTPSAVPTYDPAAEECPTCQGEKRLRAHDGRIIPGPDGLCPDCHGTGTVTAA